MRSHADNRSRPGRKGGVHPVTRQEERAKRAREDAVLRRNKRRLLREAAALVQAQRGR